VDCAGEAAGIGSVTAPQAVGSGSGATGSDAGATEGGGTLGAGSLKPRGGMPGRVVCRVLGLLTETGAAGTAGGTGSPSTSQIEVKFSASRSAASTLRGVEGGGPLPG
jgi:hypothetical protein